MVIYITKENWNTMKLIFNVSKYFLKITFDVKPSVVCLFTFQIFVLCLLTLILLLTYSYRWDFKRTAVHNGGKKIQL